MGRPREAIADRDTDRQWRDDAGPTSVWAEELIVRQGDVAIEVTLPRWRRSARRRAIRVVAEPNQTRTMAKAPSAGAHQQASTGAWPAPSSSRSRLIAMIRSLREAGGVTLHAISTALSAGACHERRILSRVPATSGSESLLSCRTAQST